MAGKDFLVQRSLFDDSIEALNSWRVDESSINLNQQIHIPKEICKLIVELICPTADTTIYDPACGAAELLISMKQFYEPRYPTRKDISPYLYGQEANAQKSDRTTLNLLKQDYENVTIVEGDALASPGFIEGTGLKTFDYVVSVLPWRQKIVDKEVYQTDKWNRFCYGIPPQRFADWGWMQHILASLKPHGRAAILVGTGAITRNVDRRWGSEQTIRTAFIQRDLIEAVILLPDNLFPNTSVPCMLLLLSRNKSIEQQNHILLVDASQLYRQQKSKKRLTSEGIERIKEVYQNWATQENFSKIITLLDAEQNSYNLNPPLYTEKCLTTEPVPHPLANLYNELEIIRTQHQQIYRELIQELENSELITLVEAKQFPSVLSLLLSASAFPNLEGSYALFHYFLPLKRIIRKELELEQEYNEKFLYNVFHCDVFSTPPHQILLDMRSSISRIEHIEDIATVDSGGTPPREKSEYFGGEINWVQIHDLNNGLVMQTTETLTNKGLLQIQKEGKTRPIGTVMVAKPGGALVKGKVGILGVSAATNSAICCIEPKTPLHDSPLYDPFYLMYYLKHVKNTWAGQAAGALKDRHLKNELIAKASLNLPILEQQQIIAEHLKAVSTGILLLEEERERLNKIGKKI